jgi:hypothetical protein
MSIREASPLGQYPTLPAGSEGLVTSSIRGKTALVNPRNLALQSRYPLRKAERNNL